MRLCRYSGVSPIPGDTFGLIAGHLVSRPRMVHRLTRTFDALQPVVGTVSCALDNGSAVVAFFRYPGERRAGDVVSLELSGCRTATNGHVVRSAALWPGIELIGLVDRLTLGP